MIQSFADEETEKVFDHRHSRRYAAFERVAFRKLRQIHRFQGWRNSTCRQATVWSR